MMKRLRPLSRQEVRQLDVQAASDLKLPSLILMENAGRGAAAWLTELASGLSDHPRILILCGPGNNGGDGGVVARHLDAWGYTVQIAWFAHRAQLRGDAETQWIILERSGVDQTAWFDIHPPEPQPAALDSLLAGADWLVDGLLGTGLTRPIEGALRAVVEAMNRAGKPILALDLPSGLDADTGAPLGVSVRARATATFAAPKLGFTAPGAVDYTGEVAVIDIGLPRCLLEPFEQ
jgi:NAD(P)H-hydrate epimerase